MDEEAENLYAQVFIDREEDHLQWTTLDEVTLSGTNYAIIVEPGQSHAETYEFIISTDVQSIIEYTYFHNSGYPRSSRSPGWSRTTVHDIGTHS